MQVKNSYATEEYRKPTKVGCYLISMCDIVRLLPPEEFAVHFMYTLMIVFPNHIPSLHCVHTQT